MICKCTCTDLLPYLYGNFYHYETSNNNIFKWRVYNDENYWLLSENEFNHWFVNISEERDRKIGELLK